jgi:hypothetical protein
MTFHTNSDLAPELNMDRTATRSHYLFRWRLDNSASSMLTGRSFIA